MKYLGIDYGLKRIGLALSETEGRMAFPHGVIKNSDSKQVIQSILGIVNEEKVVEVVIGLPPEVPGMDTKLISEIKDFAADLASVILLPIHMENEMFSSRVASAHDPKELDASSAAVILQSFLDKRNKV